MVSDEIQAKNRQALIILSLQGLVMVGVTLAPYLEHGDYDFSLTPFIWHKWVGFLINIIGFIFLIFSFLSMNKNFTIPAQPKETAHLVIRWPFSWVRNPIYFAALILGIGWSLSFWSIGSLLLTIILYLVLKKKITLEEYYLYQKFGKEYIDYKNAVPQLFPKILKKK